MLSGEIRKWGSEIASHYRNAGFYWIKFTTLSRTRTERVNTES